MSPIFPFIVAGQKANLRFPGVTFLWDKPISQSADVLI